MADVPVVVLAGFLGAGKTTVLNHLLRSAADVRLGVVVNDFGAVGIDALLVSGWADSTVSLENGCLCCSTDDGTVEELLRRLLSGRAGGRPDAVVVEASGVAEPSAMVRQVLAARVPGTSYGGLVLCVDAVEFDATARRHPVLLDHVRMADVVLVTKTDLAAPEVLAAVLRRCRDLNPWAALVPADRGRVDARLLFETPSRPQRQLALGEEVEETGADGHEQHLHHLYETVTFTSEDALDPRAFVRFLEDRPSGVFRIKGFCRFAVVGHGERFLVQTVGAAVRFTRRRRGPAGTSLVLIGTGLDREEVLARLQACVRTGPPLEDELAIMGVLRDTEDLPER
ncbi:CobW family GTP-binding protein [Kineococcus gynurae]|uniref:CobW family GTP-binding protein n=1 Tax=Kineococcus gynurae TaxID=452979 RepID=A0ABV5LRM6_9ACTN